MAQFPPPGCPAPNDACPPECNFIPTCDFACKFREIEGKLRCTIIPCTGDSAGGGNCDQFERISPP